jgi:NAD(P)-dependent dehydrogenase (short-subunit alcohol dehydrogenase family)
MTFQDKRVLVTGSSRGIGLAAARAFLAAGARVAVNGRTADSTAAAIEALGGRPAVTAAPGDLSGVAGCEAVVGAAVAGLGGLDVLVNNAGTYEIATVEATDERVWDHTLDVTLKGAFFCSRAALPALRAARGNIVNISSSAGLSAVAGVTAYCAAKAGLIHLSRAMALELAPDLRVNCVCPGPADTDMGRSNFSPDLPPAEARAAFEKNVPIGRMGRPEEIADSILWVASDRSSFMTGAVISVDGGRTAGAPGRRGK